MEGNPRYEYNLSDHLGNVRVTFSDLDGSGEIEASETEGSNEILQENHYYPFGMQMDGPWQTTVHLPENRYRYGGKELTEDFGFDWLDYGARYYDPAMARWANVDPLAESMANWSPYNYGFDSPVTFNDPSGLAPSTSVWGMDVAAEKSGENQGRMGSAKKQGESSSREMIGSFYFGNQGEFKGFVAGKEDKAFVKQTEESGEVLDNILPLNYDNSYKEYDAEAFLEFVAITTGEGGYLDSNSEKFEESQAIGDVMLNRIDHTNTSLSGDFISNIGGKNQFDAIGAMEKGAGGKMVPGAYTRIKSGGLAGLISLGGNDGIKSRGGISALSSINRGSSQGAYFFNKTAQRYWKDIGFNWRQYNAGVFSRTTAIGQTTFFKYTNPSKVWP